MANGEKEEIIDLTEVLEESSIAGKRENSEVSVPEEKTAPETEQNAPMGVSGAAEPLKASFEDYESEVRALREALNARAERWLATEGVQVLNQRVGEMIPRIAADAFGKEIEKLQAEVEKIQAQKEALQMKIEKWMASEGSRVLERVAREMFPMIAAEVLRQEIEKLKAEAEEKA